MLRNVLRDVLGNVQRGNDSVGVLISSVVLRIASLYIKIYAVDSYESTLHWRICILYVLEAGL